MPLGIKIDGKTVQTFPPKKKKTPTKKKTGVPASKYSAMKKPTKRKK